MLRDLSPNALGALYMALGSLASVINDGLVRVATENGLDVYQALFLRGCGMIVILAAASRVRNERLDRRCLTRPLVLRIAAEVVVAVTFFAAIVHLEFANVQTILMVVPFAFIVVAARLGEHVTRRRYVLVVIGFAGVSRSCVRHRTASRRGHSSSSQQQRRSSSGSSLLNESTQTRHPCRSRCSPR